MRVSLAAVVALVACNRVTPRAPAPPEWLWENPRPQGNTLVAVRADGDRVIAVGEAGTILVSSDGGGSFAAVSSGTTETLTDLTADGGGLVVVGMKGTVLASSDNRTFTRMDSPTTENLEGVWANGHGRIFAVGAHGTIWRSTNGGATFTPVISGTKVTLRAIGGTVHDEIYTVGDGGTVLVAEDNAPVWERRDSGTREDLLAVWVGPKGEVVAAGGATVVRSVDKGQTFTSAAVGRGLLGLGGSQEGDLLAFGTGGSLWRSRDAGATFAAVPAPGADTFTAATATREGTLLVGTFGATFTLQGGALVTRAPGVRARLNAVSGDVAVGSDGTVLVRRGTKIETIDGGTKVELTGVASDGRVIVAVGAGGTMLRGDSGRLLTVPSGTERMLTGVAIQDGRVVAVADDGSVIEDASVVHTAPAPLHAVTVTGEAAVAVGDGGTIVHVAPSGRWTRADSGTKTDLRAVWARGREVTAVGRRGTILRSIDAGASWTAMLSPVSADLTAVAGDADQVLVTGEHGLLLRAVGSGGFSVEPSGTTNDLLGVFVGGGAQVVVGAGGTWLAHARR